jgi:uncharacterized membrane protein YdjX (TVP38/TMEM64 family)
MSKPRPRVFLKGLVLIACFVAVAYLLEVTELRSLLDKAWIDREVRGHGVSGEFMFFVMGMLAIALGVPRQVVSFLAGYAFDLVFGTLLGVAATVGGCVITFSFARWFGRGLVATRLPERVRRIDGFIHDNTFSMTVLMRLLPVGSNLLTNLAAGVANVRALPFLLGSALGYIPQTLVFALVGSGIALDPLLRIGLGATLFLISGALGIHLFRRFRHGRHLDAELEHELGVDDE